MRTLPVTAERSLSSCACERLPVERNAALGRITLTARRRSQWSAAQEYCLVQTTICRRTGVVAKSFKAALGSELQEYISEDCRWRVRPLRREEVPELAALQAECFYEPLPVGPLNKLLQFSFQAETLSIVRQKLKYTAGEKGDGMSMLVAEDAENPGGILGCVDVSIQTGKEELEALRQQGLEQELVYSYLACMTVRARDRRKGIATALLRAAEIQAGKWNQNFVLLHVYANNPGGRALYQSAGYSQIAVDPAWQSMLGGRQRVLFAKSATVVARAGVIQSISENVMRMWQRQENLSAE